MYAKIRVYSLSLRRKSNDMDKYRLLFVCLGNICRSPAAEGVMNRILQRAGLDGKVSCDSAGTYAGHRGELPDRRMRAAARQRGYELTHRSRPVRTDDFFDSDMILAMDESNFDTLRSMAPSIETAAKVVRMTDFCRTHTTHDHVPDPYYGGAEGFSLVLDLLEDACGGLAEHLRGIFDNRQSH